MSKTRWTKRLKRLAAALVVGLAGLLLGWLLLQSAQGMRRASYDLPFRFGEDKPPGNVVLVYLDEGSHQNLGQPLSEPWDRRLHAQLVDKLTREGARVIVFDILFHDENPEQDAAFAAAIQKHGNVVLAGELVRTESEVEQRTNLLLATPALRRAAAGWGLTEVPVDPDGVVRRVRHWIPTDFGDKPSLSEFVRQRAAGDGPRTYDGETWIHYYGPAGSFSGYSYASVLQDRQGLEGVFRDKIVIVGARLNTGFSDAGKDVFATPYLPVPIEKDKNDTHLPVEDRKKEKSRQMTPGMEIQATLVSSLLEDRRIIQPGREIELAGIALAAFFLACAACLLPPLRGFLVCVVLGGGLALAGIFAQNSSGFNFPWTIPAFAQMPLIAVLALGAHYRIEYSARWKLRRAFKSYMSDEQARQIDEEEVSLELGGKEVEATILFSDLAGFTSMSEGLPPRAVSKALISYFERATEGILDNQGTIIKYIGDAVMATWGVPLKVDREADRAINAAIQMQEASARPVTLETESGDIERVLETRVGINRGLALAGNLGSRRRFDYTVIGDVTNTAARLEGLNKMLGTSILVSEAVLAKCVEPEKFLTRPMGCFVLKGKTVGLLVHEVIGHRGPDGAVRERSTTYLEAYQDGLAAFRTGDFARAAARFTECLPLHDRLPEDPASRLHLQAMETLGSPPPEWRGEVTLDSK